MKTGIVLLLLVLGQFAYGHDESNKYICPVAAIKAGHAKLDKCKEGDILMLASKMKSWHYSFFLGRCVSGTLQIVHFNDKGMDPDYAEKTKASCIYNGRPQGRRYRTEE